MKQKIVAQLDCGVQLQDTPVGITFVLTEPGREFCFTLTQDEFKGFEDYMAAYKAYYWKSGESKVAGVNQEVKPVIPTEVVKSIPSEREMSAEEKIKSLGGIEGGPLADPKVTKSGRVIPSSAVSVHQG